MKWHRTTSLLIAIPVVLWAASGFLHPIMTTIRPKVATQFLAPVVVDSSKIKFSLQQILQKNRLVQWHNFRLVHIADNWFYQVQPRPQAVPFYFSTLTGRPLNNGDALYAQYLAQQFLAGPDLEATKKTLPIKSAFAAPDCCDAATNCVLLNDKVSPITGVKRLTQFDAEYKFVNRLLPAYKVNFGRQDGIRIYVETTSDRFAFAVDNKRAIFDQLFAWFHTWSWMDAMGNAKYVVMIVLLAATLFTSFAGLYIFFITSTKKPKGNAVLVARRNHRWTSVIVSLFTILFSFSGLYHAVEKFKVDDRYDFYNKQLVQTAAVDLDFPLLQQVVKQPVTNISIVQLNQQWYWQVFTQQSPKMHDGIAVQPRKDLMKDKKVPPPNATYVRISDYSVLADGEKKYAHYLATIFSNNPTPSITATDAITSFEGEYGFVNKRLPVWKVSYATNNNERYYVETSTGKLSVRVDDKDLYEGYSFAFFHKHHFMDFAGKNARDFSTMFWSLAQIALVAIGLILWRKSTRNKSA